jgi:hypothetical protein
LPLLLQMTRIQPANAKISIFPNCLSHLDTVYYITNKFYLFEKN